MSSKGVENSQFVDHNVEFDNNIVVPPTKQMDNIYHFLSLFRYYENMRLLSKYEKAK